MDTERVGGGIVKKKKLMRELAGARADARYWHLSCRKSDASALATEDRLIRAMRLLLSREDVEGVLGKVGEMLEAETAEEQTNDSD